MRLGLVATVLLVCLTAAGAAVAVVVSSRSGGDDESAAARTGKSTARERQFVNDEVALKIPAGWQRARGAPEQHGAQTQVLLVSSEDPTGDDRAIVVGRSSQPSRANHRERQIYRAFRDRHRQICRDPQIWGKTVTPEPGSARSAGPTELDGRAAVDCTARGRSSGKQLRVRKIGTVRDGYDVSLVGLGGDAEGFADARRALEIVRESLRFR